MAQKPLPLKRIYCLDLGNADSGIAIEALEGASKFYALSEALVFLTCLLGRTLRWQIFSVLRSAFPFLHLNL